MLNPFGRIALALSMLAAARIEAQVPAIPPGTRVRIDAPKPNDGLKGVVTSQSSDSLAISTRDSVSVVGLSSIRRLDVSQGVSHAHGAIRGMTIGGLGLGGVMAGALVATYIAHPEENCHGADGCLDPAVAFPILVPLAAVVGGAAGAVVGGLIGVEQWDTVYSSRVRVSIAPTRRGVLSAGLSIRF